MFRPLQCAAVSMVFVMTMDSAVVRAQDTKFPESINLPAIQAAYQTKLALRRHLAQLDDAGRELDAIAKAVSINRQAMLPGMTETMTENLIQSIRSLREVAKAILDKAPQFIENIDNFSTTLDAAPKTFAEAANLFRTFADEEPYRELADDYRQMASLFDRLAAKSAEGKSALNDRYNRAALLQTIAFVRSQERFLDRSEAAFYAVDSQREIDAFLAQLEGYAKRFEQFRVDIRELNAVFQTLDGQPAETPPEITESPKPLALLKTAIVRPVSARSAFPDPSTKAASLGQETPRSSPFLNRLRTNSSCPAPVPNLSDLFQGNPSRVPLASQPLSRRLPPATAAAAPSPVTQQLPGAATIATAQRGVTRTIRSR
jgi:uncharacterized phage infection (PIP) family protein YhgE